MLRKNQVGRIVKEIFSIYAIGTLIVWFTLECIVKSGAL
jgi:hypothetical protein